MVICSVSFKLQNKTMKTNLLSSGFVFFVERQTKREMHEAPLFLAYADYDGIPP